MKKFILSILAVSLTAGAFAQELSKEEQKALKEQQKAITANLKAAEKAAKLSEDAMGQVDYSKVPDFATHISGFGDRYSTIELYPCVLLIITYIFLFYNIFLYIHIIL